MALKSYKHQGPSNLDFPQRQHHETGLWQDNPMSVSKLPFESHDFHTSMTIVYQNSFLSYQ